MIYRAIGVYVQNNETVIVFSEFHENAGAWTYELKTNSVFPAGNISAGKLINQFMEANKLQYQVALISVFSDSANQQWNGASIAADTGLPVITDLPEMDLALGGNGEFFSFAANKLQLEPGAINNERKAACIAFMGILRWREEYNFLSSITGASRSSIGGALWIGQEA